MPTDNIPPKWQSIVVEAIALSQERRAADPDFKGPDKLLIDIYNILVEQMRGETSDDFIPEHQVQLAFAIRRIVKYALNYANKNTPTHRKGYGESGYEEKTGLPNLIFLLGGGTRGSGWPGQSGGLPDPEAPPAEDSGDDGESFDWVSDAEINRARGMLNEVANEIRFDEDTDPLEFVREVARRLGGNWGLNGKRGNAGDPSRDILAYNFPGYQPQLFDVIVGAGDYGQHLGWSALPYPQSAGAVWIAP